MNRKRAYNSDKSARRMHAVKSMKFISYALKMYHKLTIFDTNVSDKATLTSSGAMVCGKATSENAKLKNVYQNGISRASVQVLSAAKDGGGTPRCGLLTPLVVSARTLV